jgi:hypothetical protein
MMDFETYISILEYLLNLSGVLYLQIGLHTILLVNIVFYIFFVWNMMLGVHKYATKSK